MTSKTKNVV